MKILFVLLFVQLACAQIAFAQNVFVRVRMQKNLDFKPELLDTYKIKIKNIIQQKDNGKFDVIAVVPLEDYLAGVVSKEMPLSWHIEALKAQAVVARSYVLSRISDRVNKAFHVESDQMDQVFSETDSKVAYQAVRETENVFLLDMNQKILKAYYHSDCGGQTLPANLVWSGAVDTGTAKDSWCENRQKNKWQFAISKSDYEKLGEQGTTESQIKKFKNKVFEIAGISVQKLRETFGYDQIRNAPTDVEMTEDQVIFSGQGYGHGAGLCQHGASLQAKSGRGYLDIIRHYYPKAILSDSKMKLARIKNNFLNDYINVQTVKM